MSPKQVFMQEPNRVKAHNETVSTVQFRYALDMALLSLSSSYMGGITPNQEMSAACYHKICGAQDFVKVLLGLGLAGKQDEPKGLPPNLEHRV